MDAYADLIKHIDETYYRSVHRYTTSAFLRLKLGTELGKELGKLQLSPRVYETVAEAQEKHSAK
jgi:propionate CoA-transferase